MHTSTKYGNTTNVCILCSWMSSHVLACLYICKVCIWVGAGIALQGLITQVYHIMNETIHTILNSEAMDILNSGPTRIHHTSTHTRARLNRYPRTRCGGMNLCQSVGPPETATRTTLVADAIPAFFCSCAIVPKSMQMLCRSEGFP